MRQQTHCERSEKKKKVFAVTAMIACFLTGSITLASENVEISFSNFIEKRQNSVNEIEQRLEKRFRAYRRTDRNAARPTFNESRYQGTQWANERLIDSVESYTIENLLTALVEYNLERVDDSARRGNIRLVL